jgi:hypothetical protein
LNHQDIEFPKALQQRIFELIETLDQGASNPKRIADCVMRLSTYYAENPQGKTPWNEAWCQIAYLAYYYPMNWWRMVVAIDRSKGSGHFSKFEQLVDFGSGLGSSSSAFDFMGLDFPRGGIFIESSKIAIELHQKLVGSNARHFSWSLDSRRLNIDRPTLATFSYSLTELSLLPDWVQQCQGLLVLEPATRDDGRKLMQLRRELLNQGWNVVAPCTHQEPCPLLELTERDWCHDRVFWKQPDWLSKIEEHMPIKNGTLPFSYLFLVRNDGATLEQESNQGRMTGDLQDFKGYSKQLFCRGKEREFVSWQHKIFGKKMSGIPRGSLVRFRVGIESKGNEIRPESIDDIKMIE